MSEDPITYRVRSSEPLAQVEPDADYYRKTLRRIRHLIEEQAMSGDSVEKLLVDIRLVAEHALARKRSNGEAIDRLEQELAIMRGKLVDFDVMRRDLRIAREAELYWRRQAEGRPSSERTSPLVAASKRLGRWLSK